MKKVFVLQIKLEKVKKNRLKVSFFFFLHNLLWNGISIFTYKRNKGPFKSYGSYFREDITLHFFSMFLLTNCSRKSAKALAKPTTPHSPRSTPLSKAGTSILYCWMTECRNRMPTSRSMPQILRECPKDNRLERPRGPAGSSPCWTGTLRTCNWTVGSRIGLSKPFYYSKIKTILRI